MCVWLVYKLQQGKMSGGGVKYGPVGVALLLMVITIIPTPTPASDPQADALASALREITGQLERFNSLYINKLERELSSSTAKIAALEVAVRSIGDRAAAWDNIQNHMTVWTDQSRTMERKLDLLNRCHEKQDSWEVRLNAVDALNHKLTALDKKINAMTRLEFKVEQVSERVEEVDSKINWMKKQMNVPERPIITEFAGRGVLSSLVQIETRLENITKKLDASGSEGNAGSGGSSSGAVGRGEYTSYKRPRQVYGARFRHLQTSVDSEPGIVNLNNGPHEGTTSCHLHPRDSQRLHDVSAKVDLVFDRITNPDYDYDYFVSHLARPSTLTAAAANSGAAASNRDVEPSPEHLFARFWKSIFSPFKKMNRRFRAFENQLTSVQRSCNETASLEGVTEEFGNILQKQLGTLNQSVREEMEETRVILSDQSANIEKVFQSVSNSAYLSEQVLSEVTSQFQAQRVIFQERFDESRNIILQYCARNGGGYTPPTNPYDQPQEPPYIPQEEPYSPTEAPALPYPTTPSNKTPFYFPEASDIPKFPSLTNVRNSYNQTQPTEVEPDIHTLQGRQNHRFRKRYKYRFTDPSRKKSLSRKTSKWKLVQRRRGKKKPFGRSSSDEHSSQDQMQLNRSRSRIAARRQHSQDFASGSTNRGSTRRWRRNVYQDEPPSTMELVLRDCSDLLSVGITHSSVYNFHPDNRVVASGDQQDYFQRYCDQETEGGGWTVIQRRGMFGPPYENFTRSWKDYKYGFGDINREFWWGNDNIYRFVRDKEVVIRFDLWDFAGNYAYAEYLSFSIGAERDNYRLNVFGYRGNASDSFSAHNGYLFSTYDRDNDEAPECCPCAPAYGGGWWFYSCFESNLNGEYHVDPKDNDYYRGIIWELWLGDYSLRATEIKLRPAHASPTGDDQDSIHPTITSYPDDSYPTDDLGPELPLRQQ